MQGQDTNTIPSAAAAAEDGAVAAKFDELGFESDGDGDGGKHQVSSKTNTQQQRVEELQQILLAVLRNDWDWWEKMPWHWKLDRDLTLAAIQQEPGCRCWEMIPPDGFRIAGGKEELPEALWSLIQQPSEDDDPSASADIVAACLSVQLLAWSQVPGHLRDHPAVLAAKNSKRTSRYKRQAAASLVTPAVVGLEDNAVQLLKHHILAVACNRTNWWDAFPSKWKEDPAIAVAVLQREAFCRHEKDYESSRDWALPRCWIDLPCRNHADVVVVALRCHDPSMTWEMVPHPLRSSNPEVLRAALQATKVEWGQVPTDMVQQHPTLALCGVRNQYVRAEDCACLMNDVAILRRAVQAASYSNDNLPWMLLPEDLRRNRDFALSLSDFGTNRNLVEQIFRELPELRRNPTIWKRILDTHSPGFFLKRLLEEYAPPSILSDPELMLPACLATEGPDSWGLLQVVDATALGRGFWTTVLQKAPSSLEFLPSAVQRRFPDLVQQTFAALGQLEPNPDEASMARLASKIHPSLWENRAIVLTWFEAGLPYVASYQEESDAEGWGDIPEPVTVFPDAWTRDKEIFRRIAKFCPTGRRRHASFRKASPLVSRDPVFMQEVLEHDPTLFHCAHASLRENIQWQIRIFAKSPEAIQPFLEQDETGAQIFGRARQLSFPRFDPVLAVLRELLRQHHVFCTTVLLGMSQTVDPGSSSLQVLRQDPETSRAYKRLIADYLHIPIGETLLRAQKAHHNLTTAIDERVENFVSLEDINFWVDQINNDNAGDSDSDSGGFGLGDLEFNL